jgi:hypothetical protein
VGLTAIASTQLNQESLLAPLTLKPPFFTWQVIFFAVDKRLCDACKFEAKKVPECAVDCFDTTPSLTIYFHI